MMDSWGIGERAGGGVGSVDGRELREGGRPTAKEKEKFG